jgi:hypothetical protein
MASGGGRFVIFIMVSLLVFFGILSWILRRREQRPSWRHLSTVATLVVVGGMLFAKLGQNAGLPWWVYYPVPLLLTLLLPPLSFRMRTGEVTRYLILAFLSSPAIHVCFSLLLGWKDYLPFIPVPSLSEFLS